MCHAHFIMQLDHKNAISGRRYWTNDRHGLEKAEGHLNLGNRVCNVWVDLDFYITFIEITIYVILPANHCLMKVHEPWRWRLVFCRFWCTVAGFMLLVLDKCINNNRLLSMNMLQTCKRPNHGRKGGGEMLFGSRCAGFCLWILQIDAKDKNLSQIFLLGG
jgi:hypothetical protein